ncbi:hypothetical protein B0T19DRAFT_53053 [Cercophora scortea]|uniref:Uncharacterized protein n=1 Tax=Cercophora scortea TaxID=314031 RepID=A0AAE0J4R5_9PEZI|nr:hypothetical protein B0T19DRAFT_53053 [Cercophora scortea]
MFRNHGSGNRSFLSADLAEASAARFGAHTGSATKPKHLTYTTVGSIFNPQAATAIQAPVRRPRTRKYPQDAQLPPGDSHYSFPSFVPRHPASSSTTAHTVPQYAPLQQNNDRALSPPVELDPFYGLEYSENQIATMMSLGDTPSIRSGNLPPPSSSDLGLTTSDKRANAYLGDNDSVASEGTLDSSRITVKGLTNLASYPNPMQKAAQLKLAKARTGNLAASRSNTPSSFSYTSSDIAKDRTTSVYGSASNTAGTPQPLTAGPPGQRQFRPSTFQAAMRALGITEDDIPSQQRASQSSFQPTNIHEAYGPAYAHGMRHTMDIRDMTMDNSNGLGLYPQASLLNERGSAPTNSYNFPPSEVSVNPEPLDYFDRAAMECDGNAAIVRDSLPVEKVKDYYRQGFPAKYKYSGRYCEPTPEDWFHRLLTRSWPPGPEDPTERREKIERQFYAGTREVAMDMDRILSDHQHRIVERSVGVIGEERERFRTTQIGSDGKVQLPLLSIDEVNNTEDRVHAEPLLIMALATLLRLKEHKESRGSTHNGWRSGFIEADVAWVDSSDEGRMSFFDQNKAEQPKKKRSVRKPRRGY